MMGGEISLRSEYGHGCSFTLELPVQTADCTSLLDAIHESMPPSPALPAQQREVALRGAHLLLAEDGQDNQRLISGILRQAGATVDVVADGEAAVNAAMLSLSAEPYDAILMDMEMPKMDGYGATARLRASGYQRPLLALTPEMYELVEYFVHSLPARCAEVEAAFATHDYASLTMLAHGLKGAGSSFGFPLVTSSAARLETQARSAQDPDELTQCLNDFLAICRSVRLAPALDAVDAR